MSRQRSSSVSSIFKRDTQKPSHPQSSGNVPTITRKLSGLLPRPKQQPSTGSTPGRRGRSNSLSEVVPPVVRRALSSFSLSRRESAPPPRPTIVCTNHEGHILGGVAGHISPPLGVDAFSDPRKTTNANSTTSRQTIAGKMNRPPSTSSLVRQQCGVMNDQQDERRRRSQEARPPVLQLDMPYCSSPVHTLRRVVSDSSIALSVASTCSDYSDSPSTPVARPPPDVPIDYSYSDYEPSFIITSHKDYELKAPILSPTGERAIIKPSSETMERG